MGTRPVIASKPPVGDVRKAPEIHSVAFLCICARMAS